MSQVRGYLLLQYFEPYRTEIALRSRQMQGFLAARGQQKDIASSQSTDSHIIGACYSLLSSGRVIPSVAVFGEEFCKPSSFGL